MQLLEVVDMLMDIVKLRTALGREGADSDFAVADTHLVTALAFVYLKMRDHALDQLDAAAAIYDADDEEALHLLDLSRKAAQAHH